MLQVTLGSRTGGRDLLDRADLLPASSSVSDHGFDLSTCMASCQSVLLRFLGWDGEAFIFAMSRTCGKSEMVNSSPSRPGGAEKEGQLWNRCDPDCNQCPPKAYTSVRNGRTSRVSRKTGGFLTFIPGLCRFAAAVGVTNVASLRRPTTRGGSRVQARSAIGCILALEDIHRPETHSPARQVGRGRNRFTAVIDSPVVHFGDDLAGRYS